MRITLKTRYPLQTTIAFAALSMLTAQYATIAVAQVDVPRANVNQSFDFGYEIGGDQATAPLQVFDDGERTYFQFRDIVKLLPVIFVISPTGEREQVSFERRLPYVIVSQTGKRFFLTNGVGQASIEYVGSRPEQPRPQLTVAEAINRVASSMAPAIAPASAIVAPSQATTLQPDKRIALPPALAADLRPVFRNVVFAPRATTLTPVAIAVLTEVAEAAREASGVVVYGRNDRGGSIQLAQKRASAIRDWFVQKGGVTTPINVIADPEVREDVEQKGFASSVFVTPRQKLLTPQQALALGLDPTAIARQAALPRASAQVVAVPPSRKVIAAADPSSDPRVLEATANLLKQGLLTPEMATQVLTRLRDATIEGEGYRSWESKRSHSDTRSVFAQWVKQAGWSELVWEATACAAPDFIVSGTFSDAVAKFASSLGLGAEMYTVDKVVVIKDAGSARCKG